MQNPAFGLRILGLTELNGPVGEELTHLFGSRSAWHSLPASRVSTADGFRRRDQIIAFFWPELEQTQAHLSQRQAYRSWVNDSIRQVATERNLVVDGRDMGTAVFPDADVKIYLVADPWEHAKRRLVQHLKRLPTDDEIAAETDRLVHRDECGAAGAGAGPGADQHHAPDAIRAGPAHCR